MIIFAHPFIAMTTQVIMRDPELQDSMTLTTGVKVKTMMDGSIRSRRITPAPVKLSMRFIELSRTKALEFQSFLESSAGDYIRYVDFEGVHWKGKMLLDTFEISTTSAGLGPIDKRAESSVINIDFEGTKV